MSNLFRTKSLRFQWKIRKMQWKKKEIEKIQLKKKRNWENTVEKFCFFLFKNFNILNKFRYFDEFFKCHRFICDGLIIADSSSTNTTDNASPSASPPTSIVKPSPVHHSSYLNTTNDDSDDDENEIIDDDMSDNVERPSDSNSPHPNGSSQNKRKKKTRTVFSRAQVFQLESTFDLKRYVSVLVWL